MSKLTAIDDTRNLALVTAKLDKSSGFYVCPIPSYADFMTVAKVGKHNEFVRVYLRLGHQRVRTFSRDLLTTEMPIAQWICYQRDLQIYIEPPDGGIFTDETLTVLFKCRYLHE